MNLNNFFYFQRLHGVYCEGQFICDNFIQETRNN